ncbi:hypothetical protein, partial [Microcoleus vaginatus]|uniref:hypothetical protein n=2 Tax=Microcoleus vaginatus TaxID=119532 RepID=UPI004040A432
MSLMKSQRGRVYEIVDYGQLLLVNPPLQDLTSYKSESVRESMAECPLPSLLQNRACDFHRTRLLSGVILVMDTV